MKKIYKENKVFFKCHKVNDFTMRLFLFLFFSTIQFINAQEIVSSFEKMKSLGGAEIINKSVDDSKFIIQEKKVSKSEKKISKSEKQEVKISRIKKLSKIERIVKSNHKQRTVFIVTNPVNEKFYGECIINRSLSITSNTNSSQQFYVSNKAISIGFNVYQKLNFCSQNKDFIISFLFKNKNFNKPPPSFIS